MKSYNFVFMIIAVITFCLRVSAQSDLDKKLKEFDDDVQKITINVDGKEVSFEGEDAEQLLARMKSNRKTKMRNIWVREEGDSSDFGDGKLIFKDEDGNEEIIIIEKDSMSDDDHLIVIDEDNDWDWHGKDGLKKTINVEDIDGVKIVTVTTTENGETKTETFTGEEADEYLDKMESEHSFHGEGETIDINGDHGTKKIIIKKKEKKDEG